MRKEFILEEKSKLDKKMNFIINEIYRDYPALYLDDDLHYGKTNSSFTYHNPPLSNQEFKVDCVEHWGFTLKSTQRKC